MNYRPTILIVEDDDAIAEMLLDHLGHGFDATLIHTRTAAETLRLDLDREPDLLLVDLKLPDGFGLDLVRLLQSTHKYPVLVMTGEPTLGRAVEAIRLGVREFFTKPFDLERLTCVIKECLVKHEEQSRKLQRLERLESIVHKIMDERKDLQQRVDLVCRDLVGAYHDLAHKFVATQNNRRTLQN